MIFTHWINNGKYGLPMVFLHFFPWLGDFSMVLFQVVQTSSDNWRNGSGFWRSQLVAISPAKALHEQFLATMGKTKGTPYVHYIVLWFSYMGEHIIRWKPMVKQFGKHRNTFKKMGQKSNKIRDIRELCKWMFIAGKTIEVNGDFLQHVWLPEDHSILLVEIHQDIIWYIYNGNITKNIGI